MSIQVELLPGASREALWVGYSPASARFAAVRFDRYRQLVLRHATGAGIAGLPSPDELQAAFAEADCSSIALSRAERFVIRLHRGAEQTGYCTGEVPAPRAAISTLLDAVRARAEAALAAAPGPARNFIRASPLSGDRARMIREAGQLAVKRIEDFAPEAQGSLREAAQTPYLFVPIEPDAGALPAEEFLLSIAGNSFQIQRFRSPEE